MPINESRFFYPSSNKDKVLRSILTPVYLVLYLHSTACIFMHTHAYIYIYLSSCQSINLSFQSHLMIVVRWVLCLWEQQSIWIALPSGMVVPSCICIFPCIGICLFFYFWSRFCRHADTIVENTQCSLGIAILWAHACLDFTLMDNSHLDYLGIPADYCHLDYYDVWTIAVRTILDYNDIWTIAGLLFQMD